MIFNPPLPRGGEVAVIGLGRSGLAATELLRRGGANVYVSDASSTERVRNAAAQAIALGASADAGRHDLERIAHASLLVASPGVNPAAPPLARARDNGVAIISEVEIALRALPKTRYIAVTGTNGKSTTTALIAHLLRVLGADAVEAGNIGTPVSSLALAETPPEWLALEMSSFQLHDTPSINPDVGVLTNLAPDHLDRYASVEDYYADKALLFQNASDKSVWIINGDDLEVDQMISRVPGSKHRFSLRSDAEANLKRSNGDATLMLMQQPLLQASELRIRGEHNVANVLAALLAVSLGYAGGQSPDARPKLADAARTFPGLPHRLEFVASKNGVTWINDSKATNVSSTLVGIESMSQPVVLLLGGRHKGEPYAPLIPAIQRVVRKVIAYGESAEIIERDLGTAVDLERADGDFEAVIEYARKIANSGDVVLLSPACSSYDMFTNYEERGEAFRKLVEAKP